MSFFDWFWAATAGIFAWFAFPFIIVGVLIVLGILILFGYMLYLWFVDFCKTAKDFYGSFFK